MLYTDRVSRLRETPACSEVWAGGGITSENGVSTLVASESQAHRGG
jgi:hypothetical protein